MPSFEPSYFRTSLSHLAEERENTFYSKSNYEEHWEVLRSHWNDAAGRQVDSRNMVPLADSYALLLRHSQQFIDTTELCAQAFERLSQLLVEAAHHQEQHNRLFGELSEQSEERDRSLRTSESLCKQVEEQQQLIAQKKQAAGTYVAKI